MKRRILWIAPLALNLLAGCGGPADPGGAVAERPPGAAPADRAAAAVETERVTYGEFEEEVFTGILARPAAGSGLTVVVIHDRWGLDESVEAAAQRFAGEGYVALAVDFFGGETATDPDRARELTAAVADDRRSAKAKLKKAHRYLKRQFKTGKTGVVGWGFGGSWALLTAGDADAVVVYYGQPFFNSERLAALDTPILGLFGDQDQDPPVGKVRRFESALEELGKSPEIHVFEGAGHGFANPSDDAYDAEAAADAWQKTLAFLRRHLQD